MAFLPSWVRDAGSQSNFFLSLASLPASPSPSFSKGSGREAGWVLGGPGLLSLPALAGKG